MFDNGCTRPTKEPKFRGWSTNTRNKAFAKVPFPVVDDQVMHEEEFNLSRYSPVVVDLETHLCYKNSQTSSKSNEATMGFKGTWKPAIKWGHDMLVSPLKKYIERAKMQHFCKLKVNENCDRKLIQALVERWWDSTHTFHFPCAELGLTPLDFSMLTGLSIGQGEKLKYDKKYENYETAKLYLPLLQENDICKGSISMTHLYRYRDWILEQSKIRKEACVRAFFLYLLSACIISGSNSRIRLGFMETVVDLEALGMIDWGGAAYSYLIGSMDIAVRPGQLGSKAIAGCWQVLEFWFYTYTDVGMHPRAEDSVPTFPYINKWGSGNKLSPPCDIRNNLDVSRAKIDIRSRDSIKWLPWNDSPYLEEPVVQPALDLLDRRVIIKSYLVNVWYLGDRCGMQITGKLCVPDNPPKIMNLRGKQDAWLDKWIAGTGVEASTYRRFVSDAEYIAYWEKVSSGFLLPKLSSGTNIDIRGVGDNVDHNSHNDTDPLPMQWKIPITCPTGKHYTIPVEPVEESELPPIPKLSQAVMEAKLRESMLLNISLTRMYARIVPSISSIGTPLQENVDTHIQQPSDPSYSHPEREAHVNAYFPDMSQVQEADSSGSFSPWFF